MAKKNLKVEIDTEKVDINIERKDGELHANIDSDKLDIEINKLPDSNEVKVEAKGGLLKIVGKILGKIILKK